MHVTNAVTNPVTNPGGHAPVPDQASGTAGRDAQRLPQGPLGTLRGRLWVLAGIPRHGPGARAGAPGPWRALAGAEGRAVRRAGTRGPRVELVAPGAPGAPELAAQGVPVQGVAHQVQQLALAAVAARPAQPEVVVDGPVVTLGGTAERVDGVVGVRRGAAQRSS